MLQPSLSIPDTHHQTRRAYPLFRAYVQEALVAVSEVLTAKGGMDRALLRHAMERATGGSDSDGAWLWKDAYDVLEGALVIYVRETLTPALHGGASDEEILRRIEELYAKLPRHSVRSEEMEALQQFSTPLPLAYVASVAADISAGDIVLEPSAGTGLLGICAEARGGSVYTNEIGPKRLTLLRHFFGGERVTAHNAEYIDDLLCRDIEPTVVLMNPPFSVSVRSARRSQDVTARHIGAALSRLGDGGRLVTITGMNFSPYSGSWQEVFRKWQRHATVRLSVPIGGTVYAPHGTSFATRLTVLDKVPSPSPDTFPAATGIVRTASELLHVVEETLPERLPLARQLRPTETTLERRLEDLVGLPLFDFAPEVFGRRTIVLPRTTVEVPVGDFGQGVEVCYSTHQWTGSDRLIAADVFESYAPQVIAIPHATPHPTPVVESAAMASVSPPLPTYRPLLPERVLQERLLSDIQLETVIYAGEAHSTYLSGWFHVDESCDFASRVEGGAGGGVQLRRGYSLGDGTGIGKGRQVAAVILDNWMRGRRKAIWISASDKLLEDARRDWVALGGLPEQIVPLSKFRQGTAPDMAEGIVFSTYATLRSPERQGKASRLRQLVEWLGGISYDGVVVFDEAHMLQHAASERGSRGVRKASQQGIAGLRLQYSLPNARFLYVSATGATEVNNLAYATRLGLWQTDDFPFRSQSAFVGAMERGGIAALEVVTRDLKSLGLYASRLLSFDGVRYDIVEHALTGAQRDIYDTYARAYKLIHTYLEEALRATNVMSETRGARNGQAVSAARSAFESTKQRFFNHLLSAMKCPTLIRSIEDDIAEGHAVVVQIVSTNEAVMERRLAQIPTSEWSDLRVDITPREYVMDYLAHAFPTDLHEIYSDDSGVERTRRVTGSDGNPIECREAARLRDELIEEVSLLPPVPGALDQIVQHFGTDVVAEVTGRSRRIVRVSDEYGERLAVENRPASANLSETDAFMSDRKRILVFSQAGGIGRSYHADLDSANQRLRVHYLLEAGWRADAALQGLGRTNRTNQRQPPLFRPVTTDVRGERRFIATIAKRLDSLGALTRGQRQTAGQGLFRERDNLESPYARAALRQLYRAMYDGQIACATMARFEALTGLALTTDTGGLREELPPMSQFLNRILALEVDVQNGIFEELEARIDAAIEAAMEKGSFERGVETLVADSFRVISRRDIFVHRTGSKTTCLRVERRDRNRIFSSDDALSLADTERAHLLYNERSGRVAVAVASPSIMRNDGSVAERLTLIRPLERERVYRTDLDGSFWTSIGRDRFRSLWDSEVKDIPEYRIDTFYLIAGLLLPIWDRLPTSSVRVYRLQTDDGERILGRVVQSEELEGVYRSLGLDMDVQISPAEIVQAVMNRRQTIRRGPWEFRRAWVEGGARLEVSGPTTYNELIRLRDIGCFTERVNWQMRVFVPLDGADDILAQIVAH